MKPLIVLLSVFLLSLLLTRIIKGEAQVDFSGRVAMSVMLVFTCIGHFKFTEGMSGMLPSLLPYKKELVYLTGLLELFAAAGLLIPSISRATGWMLIFFFLVLLPANIYAAQHYINYEKPGEQGPGPTYLWFRVPLQVLFVLWVYWFAVRS